LLCDVTSADTSIGAGEYVSLYQVIEGTNIVDLGWGTANAQSITISFWVKATGITAPQTYCVSVRNNASNRSYVANYTVNAAATWEKKTVTIPGETSGTWLVDNGAGMGVVFTFAAGTTIQTTANTWATGNFIATSSIGNLLSSATQEVRISGVQVEKGSTATDFDFRSYGQELALCQRYYQTTALSGSATVYEAASGHSGATQFPVWMRSSPTAAIISGATASIRYPNGLSPQDNNCSNPSLANAITDPKGMWTQVPGTWGAVTSGAVGVWGRTPSGHFISLSSEL
jgi:hypothetical protein